MPSRWVSLCVLVVLSVLATSRSHGQNFELVLSLVARSVDPVTGVKTDVQATGILPNGTFEVELRYRISDLAADAVGSRGLSSAQIEFSIVADAGVTVSRAQLTNYQLDPLSFGPPGNGALDPDTTGLVTGSVTGLIGAFRGGLVSDTSPSNPAPTLTRFSIIPLTIAAPGHQSWGTTGNPSPGNTNANLNMWPVYTFQIVVPSGSGAVVTARTVADLITGNRFGLFLRDGTQNLPAPQTSTLANSPTIAFGAPGSRACCFLDGTCSLLPPVDCANQSGSPGPTGTVCGSSTVCCDLTMFTRQPRDTDGLFGGTVTLTGEAAGAGTIRYQWLKESQAIANDTRISGATTTTLTITGLTAGDIGNYTLQAFNGCNVSTLSDTVLLRVLSCLTVTGGVSGTGLIAERQELRLVAIPNPGVGPLTYRWRRNAVPLTSECRFVGFDAQTLTLQNASVSDSGSYDCVITNPCGSTTTPPLVVTVLPCAPALLSQSGSQSVFLGQSATFRVSATSSVGALTYRWRRDGVPLPDGGRFAGVQTPVLTINTAALSDLGVYDCLMSNTCGSTTSRAAALYPQACPADTTRNGAVTVQDVFSFVEAYFAQNCP
jgi:hypothetical protein